ncbi:MAG TPA: tetratricopeptide repeat protein [Stellaceae bacterium]|nr:tetratricopeptide repeat protein [Stellaceae bacterium]
MLKDSRGLPVTAASPAAVAALDATVAAYCGLRADTGEHLKRALAADPRLVMAHILRGYFTLLFARRDFLARAERAAGEAARIAGCTAREAAHLAALGAWLKGDLQGALARWEAILEEHPRDLVALKLAHYAAFYRGDSEGMRRSLGRLDSAWDEGVPGYGFVLGCHAFAQEECGDYAAAERAGRRAVELDPTDIWAAHAVAHVMEMQDRPGEGIAWIDALEPQWSGINNFVFHARWHRCLYLLALGDHAAVLERYDRELRTESTEDYLDISNAVALLWRLEQANVDVGRRWAELAARAAQRSDDHMLVFADVHYALALAAAGERDGLARWGRSSRAFAETANETAAAILGAVGLALGEAADAHRRADWPCVIELLLPLRPRIRDIGGSHAQRDLFEQMLIDAAIQGGENELARRLLSERLARRPRNLWAWRHQARTAAALGNASDAAAPEAEVSRLTAAARASAA